jgi:multidrug efflux pump
VRLRRQNSPAVERRRKGAFAMKFSHFFIRRPIFAGVLSIFITLIGLLALWRLPVASFPEVAPPTVFVQARYPGASAETVAATVATPLEQEINGVENMLYMSSASTSDGSVAIQVTFKVGTDIDLAQVHVQNRVAVALPKLPEEVRRLGVTVRKRSPSMTAVVSLVSPTGELDDIFLSNYAYLRVKDVLARLPGVGDVFVFGTRDYSMRLWLDPEKMAARNLTAGDVVAAVREQNFEVAGGVFGQPPVAPDVPMQLVAQVKGRLVTEEEFRNIIVRTESDGRVTRLRDVARVELGARDYSMDAYYNGMPTVAIAVFQQPGSNAIETADAVRRAMAELSREFPKGMEYRIPRDDSEYIRASIREVIKTLLEAMVLVTVVVILFLQTWRASIIPLIAVPVSLIGTFAVMSALGFSLNNLTLFGLVLAIGIVVDDAIVVVENVERHIAEGHPPAEATRIAMDEIGGAVVAIALVLSSVFIPTAFLPGIQGKFYQQFALTVAVSTLISAFNALTLSPALCALLLQPHHEKADRLSRLIHGSVGWLFRGFNRWFESGRAGYLRTLRLVLRHGALAMVLYGGLLALTWLGFSTVPTGFIPVQDKGALFAYLQLPDGASLARTREVSVRVEQMIRETPGVMAVVRLDGFSILSFGVQPNASTLIVRLEPFEQRRKTGWTSEKILAALRPKFATITEGVVAAFNLPPVDGLGSIGGFKLQIQDRANLGPQALQAAAFQLMGAANQDPRLFNVLTTFRGNVPQVLLDVDREKAKTMQVPLSSVWETLAVYLGGLYINDFNVFGRPFQVVAQADAPFRSQPSDALRLRTRNAAGQMVPLGSVVAVRDTTGPTTVYHYNLYPSADLSGATVPGVSSGDAIQIMENLAARLLPPGMAIEWTELSLLEILAGRSGILIFPLCILMVFLVLAAQYESWLLPLAIILITPMSLLFAILAVWARGMDNNLFTQIGLVVLIGLACKNAVLIVEFARQLQEKGMTRFEAALEASRLRLRPILMTSFAFTVGVLPLMVAAGAGAELRRAIGTATFWGMLGVTLFGIFLTPVFYVVLRRMAGEHTKPNPHSGASGAARIPIALLIAGATAALLVSGCAVGPNYHSPQTAARPAFLNLDPAHLTAGEVSSQWWREFRDPTLERLITTALATNQDLRIASARLREARALRRVTTFDVAPTVTGAAGYVKGVNSLDALRGLPRSQREFELYDAGFDATWELDFFGRVRRSVQAARADVEAAAATRRAVALSVVAEIVRNYCELRGAQQELALARKNADLQRETLDIVRAKLRAGRGTELDVARAEAQWNAAESAVPPLETAVERAIYRLGVLTGQDPANLAAELRAPAPLPDTPATLNVGNPAELLRRRPDIRAAERALAAATARVGVATADLFPRVTFVGSLGLQAGEFSALGDAGSDTYSFGPRITWAALDLGRVRARLQAARARADAQLAAYEKTVLLALEETEGALVEFGRARLQREQLRAAVRAARDAARLAEERYRAGVAEYLTVLDAQRTLTALEDQLARAETRAVTALVAVHKALGSGLESLDSPLR